MSRFNLLRKHRAARAMKSRIVAIPFAILCVFVVIILTFDAWTTGLVIGELRLSAARQRDEYLSICPGVCGDQTPGESEFEQEMEPTPQAELSPSESVSVGPADPFLSYEGEEEGRLYYVPGPMSEDPSLLSLPESLPSPDDEREESPDRDESERVERLLEFLKS